ncbi:MAG: ATP-binding protein [Pseudomonadota bacterium]
MKGSGVRILLGPPLSLSTSSPGTGLGLAIASELIRGHGGALELDRTGPAGTVFSIRLPKGDGI